MTEQHPMLQAVLFDLDGTLADTAPDLAHALNETLAAHGRKALDFATIRPHVSHGSTALIRLGFPDLDPEAETFAALREQLLEVYRDNLATHTRLFAGMADCLQGLERLGLRWGVVTNKPGWLTEPLLTELGLSARAACIVSGDSTALRKPHPQPILHACRQIGLDAPQCIYIGDAERDIVAGRNAGMKTLVALFGYLGDDDRPQEWHADAMIRQPLEILDWIRDYNLALDASA